MSYLKWKADHIFDGYQMIDGHHVLITKEDGTIVEITENENAGDDIRQFSGILSPGFINAHCHLELSHLKEQINEKTGLVNFVQDVMKNRSGSEEQKHDAMAATENEMYQSGIVAVGDICNTADSIQVKLKSKIHWHNFIELSGFVDSLAEKRLSDAKKIAEHFTANNFSYTLVPHAPYSVSKTLFQLLNNETKNQLISVHNQESQEENRLYENKSGGFLKLYENFGIDIASFQPTGKSSLQSFLPYFTNKQSVILVHNTCTNQQDIDNLQHTTSNIQHHFCICINANRYIENSIPPIDLFRKNNCNIVIGTDSYASNHQLNILEEIKTILHQSSFDISLQETLQWATINGARALQIEDQFGSFEKNKRPGIVLISETENLKITPASTSLLIL